MKRGDAKRGKPVLLSTWTTLLAVDAIEERLLRTERCIRSDGFLEELSLAFAYRGIAAIEAVP